MADAGEGTGEGDLFVRPGVVIPAAEIEFSALRAGGPGGQNVNKVSSGVLLRFLIPASTALSPAQKERVLARLASRLTKAGELLIKGVEHREQGRNLAAARERLATILAEALYLAPQRRATRPTRGSQRRRLSDKARHGERKADRRRPSGD